MFYVSSIENNLALSSNECGLQYRIYGARRAMLRPPPHPLRYLTPGHQNCHTFATILHSTTICGQTALNFSIKMPSVPIHSSARRKNANFYKRRLLRRYFGTNKVFFIIILECSESQFGRPLKKIVERPFF